ncbi:MAG: septum formation initiator family protein [Myxococcota bacterium]|jgi:cell division protein FtsB|nr:septum formation initiator family protein [Myxococcota bacterium]
MKKLTQFQIVILSSAAIIALAIVVHTFFAPDGWQQRQKVRDDLKQLKDENRQLETQIETLKQEVSALRTSPKYQERTIRNELGYVKKEDIILELSPESINKSQQKNLKKAD